MVAGSACAAERLSAEAFDKMMIYGRTEKANPVDYKVGEQIVFELQLHDAPEGIADGVYSLAWERRGDDGRRHNGVLPIDGRTPLKVRTSLDRPGGVQILVQLVERDGGTPVRRAHKSPDYPGWEGGGEVVRFSGGALVEPSRIVQGHPEPADFDEFWARQKRRLADVPVKAELKKVDDGDKWFDLYMFKVDCAGPRPVTGYMTKPKNAKPKSCKIVGSFAGYGTGRQGRMGWRMPNTIFFEINAHGYDLERDAEYYKNFEDGIRTPGCSYGFSTWQNEYPEGSYFCGMALRVMRAYDYMKTLPEWNGRDLEAQGGSQGGAQTMWAAGLVDGLTAARPDVPWLQDLGADAAGRDCPDWRVRWTPGVAYFDGVNHARRAKCPVTIRRAGLGDTTCKPNSIAVLYNNLAKGGSVNWVQGSQHGYVPKLNLQSIEVPSGKVVRTETGANVYTGEKL